MSVLATLSSPNTDRAPTSAPRRLVSEFPTIEVEVIRFDRDDSIGIPYLLVRGATISTFESWLVDESTIADFKRLERTTDASLYKVAWKIDSPIVHCTMNTDGTIMKATGTKDEWQLDIWYDNRSDASNFQSCCVSQDIPLVVERLSSLNNYLSDTNDTVTPLQMEALSLAYEVGYFDEPRETTQEELAAELGISSSAVSSRLRRGIKGLVAEALFE